MFDLSLFIYEDCNCLLFLILFCWLFVIYVVRICEKKKKKKKNTAVVFKVEPFCICLHLSRFIYMLICDCFITDFICYL